MFLLNNFFLFSIYDLIFKILLKTLTIKNADIIDNYYKYKRA